MPLIFHLSSNTALFFPFFFSTLFSTWKCPFPFLSDFSCHSFLSNSSPQSFFSTSSDLTPPIPTFPPKKPKPKHPSNFQVFPSVQTGIDGRRGALAEVLWSLLSGSHSYASFPVISSNRKPTYAAISSQNSVRYSILPFSAPQNTQNLVLFLLSPH